MFYRNIYISSCGKLSIKNNNFLFTDKNNNFSKIPLDDINSIVIDTPLVSLTSSFIVLCAKNSVALYVCDKQHYPSAIVLGFAKHHSWLIVAQEQMKWKQSFKKNLWKKIIEQKIQNQKSVLDFFHKDSTYISGYIGRVKSGDKDGVEATIASYYFRELFGKGFMRRDSFDVINSLLNYGYALVRGNIARSVVGFGFIPALGINHKNMFNNFNLVDDLLEPFRTFVDLKVCDIVKNHNEIIDLDKNIKIELMKIFEYKVSIVGEEHQIPNAIEIMVGSIRNNNSAIKLPSFVKNG